MFNTPGYITMNYSNGDYLFFNVKFKIVNA